MEYKTDAVLDIQGNAVFNASIRALTKSRQLATVYNASGVQIPNPVSTDKTGEYSLALPNGEYYLEVSFNGTVYETKGPVTFFDPKDEFVSVKQFGAVGDGVADDTAAIQSAISSGAKGVIVPQGDYICSDLVMPSTQFFVLRGYGSCSRLKQKGGGATIIRWPTTSIAYGQQCIEGLMLDGTNGGNHCIDTSGAGGLTMRDIYVNNVPTNFSGIYINGAAGTYVHDIRVNGLRIYSNNAGHSGIRFGPLVADTSVSDFIMNGNFSVQYCAYYDIGAVTTRMTDAHPYNAANNVVRMAGGNDSCAFNSVVFDNSTNDVVSISDSKYINFTDCWFEAVKNGKSGLKLFNCDGISSYNARFDGGVGAVSAVNADSASTDVKIIGGNVGQASNFTNLFVLPGARSFAAQVAGYNTYGMRTSFSGVTASAQGQNTTQYLGVNGAQANIDSTYYMVPEDCLLTDFRVETGNTPPAGQTFTFNVLRNGASIGTASVTSGNYNAAATLNVSVSRNDTIALQSVFSATSGSSSLRYYVRFTA